MIKVYCNGTRIQCLRQGELTVGMAGAPIEFDFSEEWNGLGKTAVFRCDGARDVIVGADGMAVVPHEILTTPGMDVEVGVYAAKEDGTTWPAPTPFCRIGRVKEGADPSGDESYPPTPDVGEQAIAAASTAMQAAAAAQEVAAEIQRRADAGEFDGKNGNDYVLTETDKVEIAEIAADLVDVPEGGGSVELDTTLTQGGKAADAKAVGDALAMLENKIPTASGGMSVTAADLLVTILRNAEYSTDQSDNITALATALNATNPDVPDVPDEPDEPIVVRYAITNMLTECTNSNAATSLTEGASYTATLTASDGFVLDAVTVMMGGVDVTASVYADGAITITAVTGDVAITAVAVVANVLPFENGKTYTSDELAWVDGWDYASDGTLRESTWGDYADFQIRGANRVEFSNSIYTSNGARLLDADKTDIGKTNISNVSGVYMSPVSRTAEYIRFKAANANIPNVTLKPIVDPVWTGVYEVGQWYRPDTWHDGNAYNTNTGAFIEKSGQNCTSLMLVYGVSKLRVNYDSRHYWWFYDADKNFVKYEAKSGEYQSGYCDVEIPDGVSYVAVAFTESAGSNYAFCVVE